VTLIVDEIIGPEEVVVRPLPSLLKQHPFCSGATLSGLAQTVLLLDARRMVEAQSHLLRRWSASDEPRRAETEPSRPIVLVADDSLSARRRVVRSLSRYPIDVVEVSDGKQAMQKIQTQRFAAVFSDMEMPHLSGMDLLAAVNAQSDRHAPSIVIISSRNEPEFTDRASQLGAVDYLFKPLSDEALDHALLRIDSLRHLVANEQPLLQPSGATA
jgi:chemosensory pili system protein ChpA (sensor histidine kinase/response regulator)